MISNEDRAEFAAYALDAYGLNKENSAEYEPVETMAGDLICDLLHLIEAHGLKNPITVCKGAMTSFEETLLGN